MAFLVKIGRDRMVERNYSCDGCGRPVRRELRDQYGRLRGIFCRRCGREELKELQGKEIRP